jgi:hypothetical protein
MHIVYLKRLIVIIAVKIKGIKAIIFLLLLLPQMGIV